MTIGLILTAVTLLVEHTSFRLLEARVENQRRLTELERAKRVAVDARWNSLESRLRPHFLFNTLASIRELMHRDVAAADLTMQRFAELLRFSLDSDRQPLVPLEMELGMVSSYLDIEKMRLGKRLQWEMDIEPGLEARNVPPLSVLTLAENAIKHSIAPRRAGGWLRVTARKRGEGVAVSVADDGPGFTLLECRPGHGLDLLRERLELLGGDGSGLRVEALSAGVVVEFTVAPRAREANTGAEAHLLRG